VCAAQVPFLAGSKLGDQRQIKPVIWLSAFGALAGVSLLENSGGSPPGMGDLWSLLSAIFFGVQVPALRPHVLHKLLLLLLLACQMAARC
jgi:drug/metabolite transporter (DMT)-like permease